LPFSFPVLLRSDARLPPVPCTPSTVLVQRVSRDAVAAVPAAPRTGLRLLRMCLSVICHSLFPACCVLTRRAPLVSVYSLVLVQFPVSRVVMVAVMAHTVFMLHVCMRFWHPSLYRFPSRSQMVSEVCGVLFPWRQRRCSWSCRSLACDFSLLSLARYSYASCPPLLRLRPRLSWCKCRSCCVMLPSDVMLPLFPCLRPRPSWCSGCVGL
jgi:hypothetical protein